MRIENGGLPSFGSLRQHCERLVARCMHAACLGVDIATPPFEVVALAALLSSRDGQVVSYGADCLFGPNQAFGDTAGDRLS